LNFPDRRSLRSIGEFGCQVARCVANRTLGGAFPAPVGYLHQDVGYTDLHCHLLPGVDDGPSTLDESLAYAAAAVAAGTTTIVATPHVELIDVHELPERVDALRAALEAEGIALDVHRGGELKPFSIPDLTDRELDLIAHGPPDARWVLYEVPFHGADEAFVAGAHELRARGFGLLLAHPERTQGMVDGGGLQIVEALMADGAAVAANTGPLLGREGAERRRAAEHLLRRCVPSVVATDAHAQSRPYTLAMAAEAVEAATGRADRARRLTTEAPARLLAEGVAAARRAA
jgi:protein-tyrosine phosphatase